MSIEQMLVMMGDFLYTKKGSITDIDSDFLTSLGILIAAELERREAQIH